MKVYDPRRILNPFFRLIEQKADNDNDIRPAGKD